MIMDLQYEALVREHIFLMGKLILLSPIWVVAPIVFIVSRVLTRTNLLLYFYLLSKLQEWFAFCVSGIKTFWSNYSAFLLALIVVALTIIVFCGVSKYAFFKKR